MSDLVGPSAQQHDSGLTESTVALNPLTGFHRDDFREILVNTVLHGARQPWILGKHAARHNWKMLDVLAGRSDIEPALRDGRFDDEAWQQRGPYRRLLQSYLTFNESLQAWLADLDLDAVERLRADFLVRIISDCLAPTNTLLGNPAALRRARETGGRSLFRGLRHLADDLLNNHGIPSQVKADRFQLGGNLATSPGAVVFSNEVLELIQYSPSTPVVHRRPLLLVSAMINKFYALDLTPERSFIKFCVDSGFQVFAISWANPRMEHAHWNIETYALAVIEAIAAVKSITRSPDLNLFSLCSGAMMSSAMAACLDARGDRSIHSMSVGVCMLDMQTHDMEMSAFANEDVFARVKKRSSKAGILRGHELALSMLWLRPQELIWGNVVNNYLLGEEPPEFDLLFWNNDWTNLPAGLHGDVIDMFSTACLSRPGAMQIDGVPLDLQSLDCDKFFFAGTTDHITPWKACYRSMTAFGGSKEFLLSASGHMQTMLNSPGKKGANYFVAGAAAGDDLPDDGEQWLSAAERVSGSWWLHWRNWLASRSGDSKRAPRQLGNQVFPPGAAAPGDYVHQQSE